MRIKKIKWMAAVIAVLTLFPACAKLDVIGQDAVRAFGEVLEAFPAEEYEPNCWRLTAPDGSAWFAFDNMGVDMAVDAAPFVAAGLDVSKLDNVGQHNLNPGRDSLYFSSPGFDMLNQNVKDAALAQFAVDIECLRDLLSFHDEMGHFTLSLDDGNAFEWAQDVSDNDKDIVFVLDPAVLIDAGLDPYAVEGWTLARVTAHVDGKTIEIDKLIKAFDIQ